MNDSKTRLFVFRLAAVALLSVGMTQVSTAGMIGTDALIEEQTRDGRITRIEQLIDREDVARQLTELGADAEFVKARVGNMTNAELAELDGRIEAQVAGGDAIGVIGTVFLVLLILELVGVTDIFKSL